MARRKRYIRGRVYYTNDSILKVSNMRASKTRLNKWDRKKIGIK